MTRLSLGFPFGGLVTGERKSAQPPETSRDIVNCVPFDVTNGVRRGGIRSGTSKYFTGFVGGSGNKVQAIHSFPYQSRHVSYSADATPNEIWAASLVGSPTVSCICAGIYDDFFAVINNTTIVHYSRYGVELGSKNIDAANSDMQINAMHVDSEGSVYFATTTWISSFASVAVGSFIWKYALDVDNKNLVFQWRIANGTSVTVAGLFVVGTSLWVLEADHAGGGTTAQTNLVQYVNMDAADFPNGSRQVRAPGLDGGEINAAETAPKVYPSPGNAYPHDFYVQSYGGELGFYCAVGTVRTAGAGVWAIFKLKASNNYVIDANYLFVNDESTAVDAFHGGGIGLAIRADVSGNVYSMGRRNTNDTSSGSWVRKLVETSTAWSKAQGWARANATDLGGAANQPAFAYPRIALDAFSNLIVPTCRDNVDTLCAAKVIKNDGTLFTSIVHYEDTIAVPGTRTAVSNECRAVAVPVTHPDYQPDDYKITDTVFVAGSNEVTLTSSATGASIWGYDILSETALQVSSRNTCRLAVAAGGVYRFTTAGTTVPTNSTGRSPVMSATSRFVQAADFDGEVFFTDGQDYCVYRPSPGDSTNPNGEIVEWRATSLGVIPPRARLICRWRNRIVLAHTADSPWSWHMAAFDNPYDWDLFPPEPLETQAVSGLALPGAGDSPDLIHALIPWSDSLLFLGCARSILRFDGDPMAGGRISVVSDKIGMAFGNSWCKSPTGSIFFMSSTGGLYEMSPSGELRWLTRDTIEEDLSSIDFSQYRPELVWNNVDNGFHVWIVPLDTGGVQVRHYFYSARTGGFFPIEMGTTAVTEMQPCCAHVIDGDTANERRMLLGSEDGRVLVWDKNASGDDGAPIDARVLIGPLAGPEGDTAYRWKRPSVILARELGSTHVKFLASDTPETPEMPRDQVRIGPGQNLRLPISAKGAYCWLQLRSATRTSAGVAPLGERFAVESITVDAFPAGRVHAS